jgi:hypothetical protein
MQSCDMEMLLDLPNTTILGMYDQDIDQRCVKKG